MYGYMVISWILNAFTKNISESVVYTIGKINIEWKLIVWKGLKPCKFWFMFAKFTTIETLNLNFGIPMVSNSKIKL